VAPPPPDWPPVALPSPVLLQPASEKTTEIAVNQRATWRMPLGVRGSGRMSPNPRYGTTILATPPENIDA
jgi:hypothetical protein